MSAESTTKIPSIGGRLIEVLTADKSGTAQLTGDVAKMIFSISAIGAAAGVVESTLQGIGNAQLGNMPLDQNLPKLVAATGMDRGSRGNS